MHQLLCTRMMISKHLKGRLGPVLVTETFLHQRRSVEPRVGNGNVFGSTKHLKGRLGPVLVTVTFLHQKEVSWISLLVTETFLHQRRSVETRVGNGNVFGSKEVSWTLLLVTVTFLHQKEVSWISLSVTSRFRTKRPDDPV